MYQNVSPLATTAPAPISGIANPLTGVQIGPDTSGAFALSISGLAIQRSDGRFVAKPPDRNVLVDVTDIGLLPIPAMVWRIPATHLRPGDLIVISDNPLTVRYVIGYEEDELEVLDPDTGDITEYVPVQAPLLNFFVRVVSLMDFFPDMRFFNGLTAETLGERWHWFRGAGAEERTHMGEQREGLDIEEILLLSLLTSQQQGAAGNANTNNLVLLALVGGGRERGIWPLILLSLLGNAQPAAGGPVTIPAQPQLQSNFTLLAALLMMGRRRPEGEDRGRPEKRE